MAVEKREEEDLESLFKSLLNEAPNEPVMIMEEPARNPRISRWMQEIKLKPDQGLGKWNQDITVPITIQARIRRQGLGYQERKIKWGQDTPARKWSISKKVTRAHINMIDFDWSEVSTDKPKPKSTKDNEVEKWVQQLTRSGRAYQPQVARAEETNKTPAQSEES